VVSEAIDLRSRPLDANRIIATSQQFAETSKLPVVWIIIDTLNRVLAGGDENSSKDIGAVIAAVDRIQRTTSAHVTLIHHVPVDLTDRMRGHGSVLGAVDLTVRISKDDRVVTVEADKANDLVEKPRFAFRFQSVELAYDPDTQRATTAPVLVPCDAPAVRPPGTRKLSDRQRLALDILADCAADRGQTPPLAFGLPTGLVAVTLDHWRDELFSRAVLDPDAKNPREDFRRVKNSLHARKLIGVRDNLAWKA
jgi:hypothetical protein